MKKTILLIILITIIGSAISDEAISIDDLTRIGLESNHGLKLLRESVISSQWSKADFFTDYLPNLSLNTNYTNYTSPLLTVPTLERSYQSSSVSANVTWTLFSGGSKYLSYRSTSSNLKKSKISLSDSERQTAYRIKSACYGVIYAGLSYQTSEKNLESSMSEYELVSEKNELGLASRVDLLKMEVDLANARLSVLRSKNALKSAYRSLNQILDFPLDSIYEIADEPLKVIENPPELEFYLNRAKYSTQIMEIEETYTNSILSANQAFTSFLPTITASGSYSWSNDKLSDEFDRYGDEGTSYISVNATWYLLQGGKRITSLAQAQSGKRSAEINKQLSLQTFYNDIESTYESILESKSAYELANAQYESAEVGLELVEEQFRLGNATVLELLDARVAYQQSHNNLINALQTYRTQIARMEWLCPPSEPDF